MAIMTVVEGVIFFKTDKARFAATDAEGKFPYIPNATAAARLSLTCSSSLRSTTGLAAVSRIRAAAMRGSATRRIRELINELIDEGLL